MDIRVLNKTFGLVGIMDSAESFYWVDKFDVPGEFEIYTRFDAFTYALLKKDYYLQIDSSEKTMIIESVEITTDIENGNKLIVKGRSLESILDRRIVYDFCQIDTNLQAGLKTIINTEFINPIDAGRKVPNMVFQDIVSSLVTTPTLTGQFWHNNVYDIVSQTCQINSIGYKITLDASNNFVIQLVPGVDRSYAQSTNPVVLFSPKFDNLLASNYLETTTNWKTIGYLLGAADANGISMGVVVQPYAGMNLTPLERREMFIDLTSLPREDANGVPIDDLVYLEQMEYEGLKTILVENPKYAFFDATVDLNYFKYGVHFQLGDIVQIENEYGLTGRARVTEMTFSENPSGTAAYPTFTLL